MLTDGEAFRSSESLGKLDSWNQNLGVAPGQVLKAAKNLLRWSHCRRIHGNALWLLAIPSPRAWTTLILRTRGITVGGPTWWPMS